MEVCNLCLLNSYHKASKALLGGGAVQSRRPAVIKQAKLCELIAGFWSLWSKN